MPLNNMTNTNGLTAIGYNASATSSAFLQGGGETNWKSIRELKTTWNLVNIAQGSTANLFVSKYPVYNGDQLYIVKNDNSIHSLIANINNTRNLSNSIMTSNTTPSNIVRDSFSSTSAYLACDGNNTTYVSLTGVNSYIEYVFTTPIQLNDIYLKCENSYGIPAFSIEGSADGTNFATIGLYNSQEASSVSGKIYPILSPGVFKTYRVMITTQNSNNVVRLNTFNLLLETGESVNTTSITNGETPSRVFRAMDKVALGFTDLVPNQSITTYIDSNNLKYELLYSNHTIDTNSLITNVYINTIGNSLKEIIGKLYKQY